MIEWKDEYAIGIPLIDEQHKKLFEIAENAQSLLLMPEYIDKFDEILSIVEELKAYVVFHFGAEQGLMEKIKYPKYFSHSIEHQDFIDEMNKLSLDSIDQDQQSHLLYIVNLIIEWITQHVLEKDRVMAAYYKEVQSKS
ncbi:MAG: bacteriohemerythrin [Clostridia bacterium]|jgi:hemerythrin|nr:bacteriohemerythrin [Clostridia bacterium]